MNVSKQNISGNVLQKSLRVHGLKLGCTVSRGFGPKHFPRTNHGKKLIGKQQSTSSKAELPKNINCMALGRKQENKEALIKIEKVDDRIVCEMGEKS